MDVNVMGTWNTVMAGAQKIIDGGRGGSIILIGSAAGIKLQPFMIHYTASKHALRDGPGVRRRTGQALDSSQQRASGSCLHRNGFRRNGFGDGQGG